MRGLVALVFGIVMLAAHGLDDGELAWAFAAFAFIDGVVLVALALLARDRLDRWWLPFTQGATGIALAALAVLWPHLSGLGLLAVLVLWALVTGFAEWEVGVRLRRLVTGGWSLLVAGGLSVLAGIGLVASPVDEPLQILSLIGLFGLLYGGTLVVVAGRLRTLAVAARSERH